jgi:hypothetical protein
MQSAGYWPPVEYDLGTMYNPSAKFSTTYRWFNGRWDSSPVELVENGTLKIMNGVDASDLLPNSVSRAFKASAPWQKVPNSWRFYINLLGEDLSAFLKFDRITFKVGRVFGNFSPPAGYGTWKVKVYVNNVLKSTTEYNTGWENVEVSENYYASQTEFTVETDVIDIGARTGGQKRITYEVVHEAADITWPPSGQQVQNQVTGVAFRA